MQKIHVLSNGKCNCQISTFSGPDAHWQSKNLKAAIKSVISRVRKLRNERIFAHQIQSTRDYGKSFKLKADWFSIGILIGLLHSRNDWKKEDLLHELFPLHDRHGLSYDHFKKMLDEKVYSEYGRQASRDTVIMVITNYLRKRYEEGTGNEID